MLAPGKKKTPIAFGDIGNALELLPKLSRSLLIATYDSAFQSLLHILMVITILSAIVVFAYLGKAGSTIVVVDPTKNLWAPTDSMSQRWVGPIPSPPTLQPANKQPESRRRVGLAIPDMRVASCVASWPRTGLLQG